MLISFGIAKDGFENLYEVVTNLMDEAPKTTDRSQFDPRPAQIASLVKELPWVADARARMREAGHAYYGEVFLFVSDHTDLVQNLLSATEQCRALNWRVHDVVLVPVESLE